MNSYAISPLLHVTAAYLNEDWELDYPDVRAALDDAAKKEPEELLRGARDEAAELLAGGRSEEDLAAAMRRIHVAYRPAGDEMTYRQFLKLLIERLSPAT